MAAIQPPSIKISRITNKACVIKKLSYAELRDKPIHELTDEEFYFVLKTLLYLAKPEGDGGNA